MRYRISVLWLVLLTTVFANEPKAQTGDSTPIRDLARKTIRHSLRGCGETTTFLRIKGAAVGEEFSFRLAQDPGPHVFNRANDLDFDRFASYLTDTTNDDISFCVISRDHELCTTYDQRSVYFERQGYIIDEVWVEKTWLTCSTSNRSLDVRWSIHGQEDVGQPIASLALTTQEAYPGQTSFLRVVLDRTETATLEPGFGSIDPEGGLFSIQVDETQVYTLTATNAHGVETRTVVVTPTTPDVRFNTETPEVFPGEAATLTWSVSGATTVVMDPPVVDPVAPEGSVVVRPEHGSAYKLTACNSLGCEERTRTFEWKTPFAYLSSIGTAYPGNPFELRIELEGADSATLEPGFGTIDAVNQSLTISLDETTTFELSATNAAGTSTTQRRVIVSEPRIGLTVDPLDPEPGEEVSMVLDVRGADTAWLEPIFGEIPPESAVYSASIQEPTTVVLRAENSLGTVETESQVVPMPLVSFSVEPELLEPGQTAELSWESLPFANVEIDDLGPQPSEGSRLVRINRSTNFTLRATHPEVEESATVTAYTGPPDRGTLEFHFQDSGFGPYEPKLRVGVPFDVFVVAVRAASGVGAFEFGVEWTDCLSVLERTILSNELAIDVGLGPDNWIVGLNECSNQTIFTPLVKYTFLANSKDCLDSAVLSAGPSSPSTFDPPQPGYLSCGPVRELDEFLPLRIPDELRLAAVGTEVPALDVRLVATARPDGIELRWTGQTSAQWIRVLRSVRGSEPVEVFRVDGPTAGATTGWFDRSALAGEPYAYRVTLGIGGVEVSTNEAEAAYSLLRVTRLLANRPNPFNPRTEIRFELARPGTVRLEVLTAAGRRVRVTDLPELDAGSHGWIWDGRDDAGREIGSGVYFVRLITDTARDTQRVVLLR